MKSWWVRAAAGSTAILSVLPAAAVASTQAGLGTRPLPGSAVPFTSTAKVIGAAPAFKRLSIQVWLRPRLDCPFQVLVTNDDQSTSLFGYAGQVTLRGYDNMTGVGTPDDPAFITALRRLEK